MNARRPRDSILCLFDPLAVPSTPERETPSADSASDKENDGPGQVTVFFNRIYTKETSSQPVSTSCKGNLIDFGDTSLHDEYEASLLDEDCGGLNFGDDGMLYLAALLGRADLAVDDSMRFGPVTCAAPGNAVSPLRQPLADIRIETVSEPVVQPKLIEGLDSPERIAWPKESNIVSPTVAPKGAPLADVINSINLSALSLSRSPSPTPSRLPTDEALPLPENEDLSLRSTDSFPEISVCPPDEEPVVPSHPTTPISSPESLSAPRPAMRRLQANTSAADPRRVSVDLQSSFSLQMQSPEMSFDLLNDKISFLSQEAMEGDDTLDFRTSPRPMPAIAEEAHKPIPPSPPMRAEPLWKGNSRASVDNAEIRPAVFSMPQCSEESISTNQSEHMHLRSVAGVTNTPVVPAPKTSAPALRIVKKAWKMHDRTFSTSSASTTTAPLRPRSSTVSVASSSTSSRCSSRADHLETEEPQSSTPLEAQAALPEPTKPRAIIRGLQRPPPGAQVAPAKTAGHERMRSSTRSAAPAPQRQGFAPTASTASTTSSRRTSISQRASTVMAALSGKALRPTSSSLASSTSTVSGLRPPQKTGSASASSGARSGLPLPSSRLPAPTSGTGSRGLPTRTGASKLPGVTRRAL